MTPLARRCRRAWSGVDRWRGRRRTAGKTRRAIVVAGLRESSGKFRVLTGTEDLVLMADLHHLEAWSTAPEPVARQRSRGGCWDP